MKTPVSHPYDMQLIPARLLTVNRCYQREAQTKEINDIISNFDYHLVNPVKVVKRDGLYYICDGQQTATAMYQKFGPEYLVPCFVYTDIETSKGEAELLAGGNTGTGAGKKLTQNQLWDALMWAEDPTAHKINSVANQYGYNMGSRKKQKKLCSINAVDAVRKAYKNLTEDQFNAMFRIIHGAWEGNPDGVTSSIIRGMARFIRAYYGEYNEANLIRRLSKKNPLEIIRNGRASFRKGDAKWAREILEIYNSGTSVNRLPEKL